MLERLHSLIEDRERPDRMKQLAMFYASLGVPVVRLAYPVGKEGTRRCSCKRHATCRSQGKHPLDPNGLLSGTTSIRRIEAAWGDTPYNIGLVCRDITVLDHDNFAATKALEATVPDLWTTSAFNVRTPRGGVHQYFASTRDVQRSRTALPNLTQAQLLEAGRNPRHPEHFDWLAGNSLVVAAGSVGMDGEYKIERDEVSGDVTSLALGLSFAPELIVRRFGLDPERPITSRPALPRTKVFSPEARGQAFLRKMSDDVRYAPKGTRNTELNRVAFTLFKRVLTAGDLDSTVVRDQLTFAASEAGLDLDEIETTLRGAWYGAVAKSDIARRVAPDRGNLE